VDLVNSPRASIRYMTLRALYDIDVERATMKVPPGMAAKLKEAGKSVSDFETQSIVSIADLVRPQESVAHNRLRSQRFGNTMDGTSGRDEVTKHFESQKCTPKDFCEVESFVGAEQWGRLHNEKAITGSNMAKIAGNHGLIITTSTFQPMMMSADDYRSQFELSYRWFEKSHQLDPSSMLPTICFDSMFRGGASMLHPHFQVFLHKKRYSGKFEALLQAAIRYGQDTHTPHDKFDGPLKYFTDLISTHCWLGLCFAKNRSFVAFVPLTAATGLEIDIVGSGSHKELSDMFHHTVEAAYLQLGWTAMSVACALPAMKPAVVGFPVTFCRIVMRGSFTAHSSDVSANELFATTSVSTDVFVAAHNLRMYFLVP